jgi:hypothetical protein
MADRTRTYRGRHPQLGGQGAADGLVQSETVSGADMSGMQSDTAPMNSHSSEDEYACFLGGSRQGRTQFKAVQREEFVSRVTTKGVTFPSAC